jgi:putative ABC transport system permease protein
MSGRISASLSAPRVNAFLLTVFAGMALLLAAAGIYATMLYAVGQRSREVAVRVAIGARPFDVVSLVVRQGMGLALAGVTIGLAGTLALSRTLRGLVFGVATTDPPTLLAGAGVLLTVALVACLVPARSATRVDPMAALKSE